MLWLSRQEKFPGLSRNEPQAPLKIVLLIHFHEDFCEVRATMEQSKREVGIISSDSYYLLYIITNNENSYARKLKDMTFFKGATSRFAYLEKSSLV